VNGDRDERLLALLRRHGRDAVSFLAFESGMQVWIDDAEGGGMVAYHDTGEAWIAAGAPIAEPSRVVEVARRFVDRARAAGRRACFFAAEGEDRAAWRDGFSLLLLGEQPFWVPAAWPETLKRTRSLREQIRRARAKGVTVRRVRDDELAPGSELRGRAEALAKEWLDRRRMAPMGFLVALEPFHLPGEHRYFVAERRGAIVGFLSAVPIYARRGWMAEDVVRSRSAPNGTTEAMIDALMRDVAGSDCVTLGLAPLSGPIGPWMRGVRRISMPFFDFDGLRAFRQRLRPERWEGVWLVYPRRESALGAVVRSLRAFAGGSLFGFAARSVARGPSGAAWALALPLVPWTIVLAALAVTGHAALVGFSPAALAAWVVFDALLSAQLLRSAMRPRPARLAVSATAAVVDASVSVPHLAVSGFGRTFAPVLLRSLSAFAPCVGAIVLTWLAVRCLQDGPRAS
jgi:phosphatidylglycerol lysyltransferase